MPSIGGGSLAACFSSHYLCQRKDGREIGMCPFPFLGLQLGSGICLVTIDRHNNYDLSELNGRLGMQSLDRLPHL